MRSVLTIFLGIMLSVTTSVAAEKTWTESGKLWTAKTNLKQITGLKVPAGWESLASWGAGTFHAEPLPASLNWREKVKAFPAVVNQGNCGSCWAFATSMALAWQLAIRDGLAVDLSEQEILAHSGKGSCGGGYYAHDYQLRPGQSKEEECPYTASNRKCAKYATMSHEHKLTDWGYVGERGRRPTVDEIKAALLEYGPVAVTVTANSAMSRYAGGVFGPVGCSSGGTNHMVILYGWDDAQGVWLMQNSWGVNWGEAGTMRIKYGCSRIGEITSWVEAPGVVPPPPVESFVIDHQVAKVTATMKQPYLGLLEQVKLKVMEVLDLFP